MQETQDGVFKAAERVREAMAELEAFEFGAEEQTPQPGASNWANTHPSVTAGPVPPSPTSAADTLKQWQFLPLCTSSAAAITPAALLPPTPHSRTASSLVDVGVEADGFMADGCIGHGTTYQQADEFIADLAPSEVASPFEECPVFRTGLPTSPSESNADGGSISNLMAGSSSMPQLTQYVPPAMERVNRLRREAWEDSTGKDPLIGMMLTPLNEKPFQALSSIARQAHSVLLNRLAPHGKE